MKIMGGGITENVTMGDFACFEDCHPACICSCLNWDAHAGIVCMRYSGTYTGVYCLAQE